MAYKMVRSVGTMGGGPSAKIEFNGDLAEYRVRFYRDGTHVPGADYFTDDLNDATGTASAELARMRGE